MPIYEYRCASCGFQSEYLQKVSDPILSVCPQCGTATFNKLVTAAGFQLKGSGWYATDFKGSGTSPAAKKSAGDGTPAGDSKATDSKPPDSTSSDSKPDGEKKAGASPGTASDTGATATGS